MNANALAGNLSGTRRIKFPEPVCRVLIVDDDEGLAKALQRVLVQSALHADIALDGPTAISRLRASNYDVMVLDLRMANMDGLEVFEASRRLSNPPEAILHSAFLDVPTTVTAMRAGVSEVLEKPVAAHVLTERIEELVRRRRSPSSPGKVHAALKLDPERALERLMGESQEACLLREQIRRVSDFRDVAVLVEGPTGSGKELVAQAIHALTAPNEPFVCLNCAAVPEQLFESELFGHEAGAFTSARGSRSGLLEEAAEGTIFLDEVGEMPSHLQPKLLRVLETREFRRVGSNRTRRFGARVVAATNRSLTRTIGQGFRADLYFRLAGYTITIPALSERTEDIPLLGNYFLNRFTQLYGLENIEITPEAFDVLARHDWPGNVRELRAVVEHAAIICHGSHITAADFEISLSARGAPVKTGPRIEIAVDGDDDPDTAGPVPSGRRLASVRRFPSLREMEQELILQAYTKADKNLSRTARELGIPRSTLRDKLKKYGAR